MVVVTTASAPRTTASRSVDGTRLSPGWRGASLAMKASRVAWVRLQTRTSDQSRSPAQVRSEPIPTSPAPTSASTFASLRASQRIETAADAPVRIMV